MGDPDLVGFICPVTWWYVLINERLYAAVPLVSKQRQQSGLFLSHRQLNTVAVVKLWGMLSPRLPPWPYDRIPARLRNKSSHNDNLVVASEVFVMTNYDVIRNDTAGTITIRWPGTTARTTCARSSIKHRITWQDIWTVVPMNDTLDNTVRFS